MGSDRHYGGFIMNEKFIMETVDNLQIESEQLNCKMKKAREDENWGTYKNIVQAYEKILDLLSRYNVKPIKIVNLKDEIINEYNSIRDTDKIIELIKKEYNIYDVTDISPEQEYKVNKLIEGCLLKILDNKLKSYSSKCIYETFVTKHGIDKVQFNLYPDGDFIVKKEYEGINETQSLYKACLTVGLYDYKINIGNITISKLLNKEYNVFVFLSKVVDGYYKKILELKDIAVKEEKLENKPNTFGIGLGNTFIINKHDNYIEVKFKFGIGGIGEHYKIIN
jgi:hypothetical protein